MLELTPSKTIQFFFNCVLFKLAHGLVIALSNEIGLPE